MSHLPALDPHWLPDYQAFRAAQTGDFTLWNYLDVRATTELAAAFSTLFWPDVIETDGCVLLAEHFDPAMFALWHDQLSGNIRALETTINELHIYRPVQQRAARELSPCAL